MTHENPWVLTPYYDEADEPVDDPLCPHCLRPDSVCRCESVVCADCGGSLVDAVETEDGPVCQTCARKRAEEDPCAA